MMSVFFPPHQIRPGTFRLLLSLIIVGFHVYQPAFFYGPFAVYSFFILSGFWITRMYAEKYVFLPHPLRTFWLGRAIRLMPLFWINILIIIIVSSYLQPDLWTKIQGFSFWEKVAFWLGEWGLLGYNLKETILLIPAWSLDVEVQFYLVFPFIFWMLNKWKKKDQKKQIHSFSTNLFPAKILFYILLSTSILWISQYSFLKETLTGYLLFFMLGWAMYQLPSPTKKWGYLSLFIWLFIISLHFIIPDLRKMTVGNYKSLYNHWLNFILPILLIPFIAWNVRQPSNKIDHFFGRLSYPVYLFHWPCALIYGHFADALPFQEKIIYLIGYLAITLLGGTLQVWLVDLPIEHWRKEFLTKEDDFK